MTTLSVQVPEDIFSALRLSPEEIARELPLAAAILWYSKGLISQEKAAHIAGLSRAIFLNELAKAQIPVFHVDLDEVRREALSG